MATKDDMNRGDGRDAGLEALFSDARAQAPAPDLVARVLADAEAVQAAPVAVPERPVRARGWLAELVAGLGGWSVVSGITAAGVAGLAVGLYAPDTVSGWIDGGALPFSSVSYDVTPDITALWTEAGDV